MSKTKKPEPAGVAAEYLSFNDFNNFINFLDFLQANSLKPRWIAKNAWEVKINNNQILRRLRINPEEKTWSVNLHFFWGYNEKITDDELKYFVWSNLRHNRCPHDAGNCRNYSTIDILGKPFDKMCCVGQITIINPAGKALEHTKELVLKAKAIIEEDGKITDKKLSSRMDYSLIGSQPTKT